MAKKVWKLIEDSIYETKTAAGHFLKGYRGGRFGMPKVKPGTVKVGKVGKYFGVFDCNEHPRGRVISIAEGKRQGDRYQERKKLMDMRRRRR